MNTITIEEDGYTPVTCEQPLPCPFCGGEAKLQQVAHSHYLDRKGKPQRMSVIASTNTLTADTFWFECSECGAKAGKHSTSAQAASEQWNRRHNTQDDPCDECGFCDVVCAECGEPR